MTKNTSKLYGELDTKLKNKKEYDYNKFKRKISLNIVIFIISIIVFILLVYSLISGKFGNLVVYLLMKIAGVDWYEAREIYRKFIGSNKIFMIASFVVFLFTIFSIFFSRYLTRYFDEINIGLDNLIEQKDEDIVLSAELEFMEDKLRRGKKIIKQREEDVLEAENSKNKLLLYLAHDIKTPLTSVVGYLNLLNDMPNISKEEQDKYIKISLDKANRLEGLIEEFFDIAKYNLDKIKLNKEWVNLNLLVGQVIEELYPLAIKHGNKIVLNSPKDIDILVDPSMFARVLGNILKNAIMHSFDDTDIVIDIYDKCDELIIELKNKGESIDEIEQEKIFEMFYRLSKSRASDTGGSGIGLAVSQKIMEAHGGDIVLYNKDNDISFSIILDK